MERKNPQTCTFTAQSCKQAQAMQYKSFVGELTKHGVRALTGVSLVHTCGRIYMVTHTRTYLIKRTMLITENKGTAPLRPSYVSLRKKKQIKCWNSFANTNNGFVSCYTISTIYKTTENLISFYLRRNITRRGRERGNPSPLFLLFLRKL